MLVNSFGKEKIFHAKRYFQILFFLFLILWNVSCNHYHQEVVAQKGLLDLQNQNFDANIFHLNGEWEFFWNKGKDELDDISGEFVQVPGTWNKIEIDGKKNPAHGFATYRLKILLPPELVNKAIALKLRHVLTSYRLYINDHFYTSVGTAAKDAEYSKAGYRQPVVVFFSQLQEVELVLEVANFSYSKAGLLDPFFIGTEKNINLEKYKRLAYDLFLLGVFSVMSAYYLGLYSLRRQNYSFLFFSLFSFMFMLRSLTRGEMFIDTLFFDFPFALQIRIEYLSYYLSIPFLYWFLHLLFEKQYKKITGYIITAIVGIFTAVVLFTSITFFTSLNIYFQAFTITMVFVILFYAFQAIRAQEKNSVLFLFALIFFAFTVVNDILYTNGIFKTFEMTSVGLFVLIFVQSFMLSERVNRSLVQIKELTAGLESTTKANSRFVPETILSFLDKQSILEVQLGDATQKRMAILSAEASNWAEISSRFSTEDNFVFINSYLNLIGPLVRKHNGFMEKYLGDGFMAIFPENSLDAVAAAVAIQEQIKKHVPQIGKDEQFSVKLAMGIHVDELILGTIGEEEHIDTTIISGAVSCSSLLKDLSKRYEAAIVVSAEVKSELPDEYVCRRLGKISSRVKETSTTIYEVLNSCSQEDLQSKLQTIEQFDEAINFYQKQDWQQAEKKFKEVLTKNPHDKTAQYFFNNLREDSIQHF